MADACLSVRNFDKFQHYSKRRPPWIKLYAALWRDYKFRQLTETARYQLIGVFVLASQHENRIPYDPSWLRDELGTRKLRIADLIEAGFVYQHASVKIAENDQDARHTRARTRSASVSVSERESEGEDFKLFWAAYPRHEAKKAARKAFDHVRVENGTLDAMLSWLERAKSSEQWRDPGKIPHASTFLNQERWKDDPPPPPATPGGRDPKTGKRRFSDYIPG